MTSKKQRTCVNGHKFYKSSDCPVCPICDKEQSTKIDFLSNLAAPARRALVNQGIETVEQLAEYSEKEIMKFHGMGKSSLPKLQHLLIEKGLVFKP
jgi:DNA-directed RNA polymerase alpha subunit